MGETASRTIVTMNGRTLTFIGDEGDAYFQGLEAFHNGSPQFESFIRANLRPDSHCVDVGANIGLTTALLAAHCPAGRVYAVEASPRNAHYLRQNLEANNLRNCVVLETAVGDRCGSVSFLESSFGAGSHVLSGESARSSAARTIPLATLDSLFSAADARPIDFMKMDVEGFEPLAICGAARLIERDRCAIFMEFNSWCLQVLHEFNPFAFARSLTSAFHVTAIGKGGEEQSVGHADVHGFMYRNIMQNGCVDDVVLRLREGARVPSLARMVKGSDDLRILQEAERLRRELREERDRRYFGLGKWMAGRTSATGDARRAGNAAPSSQSDAHAPRPAIVAGRKHPSESADSGKNMHLQLLRALAITFVLGAHLSITSSLLMNLPFAAFNPGWIGVELFFVVSGYVVALSMARAQFAVASFVIRRVFRLYPLLLFFLLFLLAVKLATDALAPGAPALLSPSLEAMYHQALAMLLAYHPTAEWGLTFSNMAVWSLSVELRFYAALAIFVALLNLMSEDRDAHRRNILIAASLVYLTGAGARILSCFGITFEIGELIIGKMYEFIALGTIAALLPASWRERIARHTSPAMWFLVFAPLMLMMVVGSPGGNPGSHPAFFNLAMLAVGLMFWLVVIICTSQDSAPHLSRRIRALGNLLGDRSYAIFLLHLPVLNLAWALGQRFGQDGGYWQWPLFQLAIALVLLPPLVEVTHRYIELPMIDAGRSVARRLQGLRRPAAAPIRTRAARQRSDLPWERVA